MTLISTRQVELLKTQVLIIAGIKNMVPADCRLLEHLITNKTKQRVSETTIKRLYGFALSQFKPSLFTVDVLAKYCDYNGWTDFYEKQDQIGDKTNDKEVDWKLLQYSANKITGFTIQALKNRSGIPYNFTIPRKFIDEHINDFLETNNTGTVVCAPAGYGKTLSLCHWVEQKTEIAESTGNNDIILFFSSNALMSVLLCGKDINHWMLALLGYNPDQDLSALLDVQQRKAGKFYLIIDGFDEHMFKHDQFQVILNQLVDIFSFYQSHDWFKLILTMRSSTWINNKHQIELDGDNWHTGFIPGDNSCVNVPLFSINEIEKLSHKINPGKQYSISAKEAEIFKYPLYFQFYYKQNKIDFSLNNVDHVCLYNLISIFILNKIYLGPYSTEKALLIDAFVDNLDITESNYSIDKLKVNNLIKKYQHAYSELLSIGFLREINESNDYQHNAKIQFVNDGFLEHSIAKNLLHKNNEAFSSSLIATINQLFKGNIHKLAVIKWCVIHAIKTGQQDSFEKITEFDLTSNEKSELILFLGDLLDNESSKWKGDELLINYFSQSVSDKLFNYFFGLELIHINYHKTLNTLLKFELSDRKKILIYTYLGIGAVVKLDMAELESLLLKLKSFPVDEFQSFIVNPLNCLDTLYHYLKYGIIKKDALRELTTLCLNNTPLFKPLASNEANDMLYLLGLYTIALADNPKKTIRFANFIKTTYKNDELSEQTTPYSFFVKIMIADSLFMLGKHDLVSAIYYSISEDYKKSDRLLTPYMKMLFHCLKVKVLVNTKRETDILDEVKCINAIADESGYKFSKLYILTLLLKTQKLMVKYPDFYKQVNYSLLKMIRENELNKDVFTLLDLKLINNINI